MQNCDHAWIKIGEDGVLHVAWSDEESWEERLKKPASSGNWQLVLSPIVSNGEIAILRGHFVEFFEVKKMIGDEAHYGCFGYGLYSYVEEPLKKIAEEFVFSEKNYTLVPEETTGSLWWKHTKKKHWKIDREYHWVCKREQKIHVTELVTADRYVLSKKEIVR